MDLNGIRYALSALSLIALVLALVLYFGHDLHKSHILIVTAVVMKLVEIVIRFIIRSKKKQKSQLYGE